MLTMKVEHVVHALVEQLLVQSRHRTEGEALHFHFDLGLSNYEEEVELTERRGLHLLYFLPLGRTYVTVFSAMTDSPFTKIDSPGVKWVHEATHDSCWRSINAFSKLYFDMAERINVKREKLGLNPIAPKEMTEHNSFALFSGPFRWLKVEVTQDPSDPRQYRKQVKVFNA